MTASGVVAVQPAERVEVGLVFAGPVLPALERLALESRVEGSASALSALEPIELMDWRTPAAGPASAPPADRTTPSSVSLLSYGLFGWEVGVWQILLPFCRTGLV